MTHWLRVCASLTVVVAASVQLSGCLGSPRYGTDKTAAEQLFEDIGNVASIGTTRKTEEISYAPRPELVVPATEQPALPAPQQTLASRENNPDWLESPEQTRQRLRKEAEANPTQRSPLLKASNTTTQSLAEQRQAYRAARKVQQGIYDERRLLSDPPVEYRRATDEAALEDLGEPELVKERRRKKEAKAAQQSNSEWWRF